MTSQWDPLTLKGAGLFHLAMGAVLGVAAWSRGQEKMSGASEQIYDNLNYEQDFQSKSRKSEANDESTQ